MMIDNIEPALVVELHKRWARAHVTFGDVYSAICRPGSWEYQLPIAATLRALLRDCGYEPTKDPDADWRLIWTRITGEEHA